MALATLIAITLGCIGWSLWIRRVTWSCRWEVAATLNIALQGLAVILMSPFASETLGHWLHALTGMWNLEDYIGHDAYIVAASAVVYNARGRPRDADDVQTVRRAPCHAVHPAPAGDLLDRQRRACIPVRLLRGAHRLLAGSLLVVAVRLADLPAGLRCAGPADPAEGSAFTAHRQHLPRRICKRHPRLHRADPHRLRAAAAGDRGWHAGVDLRVRVWRRIRVDVRPVLAHQDQVVQPHQSLTDALVSLPRASVRRPEHPPPAPSHNRDC